MATARSQRVILNISGYSLLQLALARVDPERAHQQTIRLLKRFSDHHVLNAGLTKLYRSRVPDLSISLFGRPLANPIGLAAGFDKNGVAYPALAALGFGFVEIGTVTPKPQPGNPGRRIFRLNREQSIINRLGFNSDGLESVLKNISQFADSIRPALLGINLGKNKDTPNERAYEDYVECLDAIYPYADYVVLNLSSPNTPDLRSMQRASEFDSLLRTIMDRRSELAIRHSGKILPTAVKLSPDLEPDEIDAVSEISLKHQINALIATNTTTSRTVPVNHRHYAQQGGLSGRLLRDRSTAVIRQLADATQGQIPIIGVGGISSDEDAWDKLIAGATALQLYTALVFQGPDIVRRIVTGLASKANLFDSRHFTAAIDLARQQN